MCPKLWDRIDTSEGVYNFVGSDGDVSEAYKEQGSAIANLSEESISGCMFADHSPAGIHRPTQFFKQVATKVRKSTTILDARIHVAAFLPQVVYAGFRLLALSAVVGDNGFGRPTIFICYRNAIATLFLAPFAFFLERDVRPCLTFHNLIAFFFSAFIGVCINQILFVAGLWYTTPTFTAVMQNITPAFTFALASLLRIERIGIRSLEGQAKMLGMVIAICGATYIGLSKDSDISSSNGDGQYAWHVGVLCLLGNGLTWSMWFLMQNPITKVYPASLSATTFTYILGCCQLASIALVLERNPTVWISTFYSDVSAIVYGGILTSGVAMTVQAWCVCKGGPILVAAYQPLQMVLVAILSSIFLGEKITFHSVIGGLFIVIGLYLFLWGRSKEGNVNCAELPILTIGNDMECVLQILTTGNDLECVSQNH